jgi:cytochrome P450
VTRPAATAFDPTGSTIAGAFDAYADAHRGGCPIVHSDAHGGFWMVVGYDAARTVLTDHERFRSGDGVLFPDPGAPKNVPLELDPPEHRAVRTIFSDALSTPKVRATGVRIQRRIDALIDGFVERGSAELNAEYAGPLTLQTIAEHIGVPHALHPEMQRAAHNLMQSLEQPDERTPEAIAEFSAFALQLIHDRRADPRDDPLTVLANAEVEGRALDPMQAVGYFTGFLIAGHDTTRASLCRLLHVISRDDDLRARLIADPESIERAVEESLRLRPPFHFFRRTVAEPAEIDGVELNAGDPVLVSFAAANRDPGSFPDPDTFRLDRTERRHLTFGHGIHLCAGAALARTQLRLAVAAILRRIPDYRSTLVEDDTELPLRIIDSITELPVVFTPGTRTAAPGS